jgi:heme A synthase
VENEPLSKPSTAPAMHRFAILLACVTFLLLFVGALVMSTGSGLSVPTWPLAWGKLIPPLVGGVRYEYAHRVIAGLVVVLTLTMAVWAVMAERRRIVRNTAIAAFALVIVQALLGGLTVLLGIPLPIAMAHTSTAIIFFCTAVALAIFTGRWFEEAPHLEEPPHRLALTTLGVITTLVVYCQIVIGSVVRFVNDAIAIRDFPIFAGPAVPGVMSEAVLSDYVHLGGAIAVTFFVLWTSLRVFRSHLDQPRLVRLAEAMVLLLALQILLGLTTVWSDGAVIPASAHVAVGAAVLATSVAMTLCAFRLYGRPRRAPQGASREPLRGTFERKVTA